MTASPNPRVSQSRHITSVRLRMGDKIDLSEIKHLLKILNLPEEKLPTLAEYKSAYREGLKGHPDKGGETAPFQDFLSAATAVFQFITKHQASQTRADKSQNKELLKTFEASNGVNYNKGNITFHIEPEKTDLWIKCLAKKLSEPVLLTNGSGFQMKVEDFKIPLVSYHTKKTYGSISVTVWPTPSDGQPKVCVQGTMYLAFITFVLPAVLNDMKKSASHLLGLPNNVEANEDTDTDDEENAKIEECANKDLEIVNKSLKRMEMEVININSVVASKVDAAISAKIRTEPDITNLEKRVDGLENLLKSNLEQFSQMTASVEKLTVTLEAKKKEGTINIDKSDIKTLTEAVTSHPKFIEVSETLSVLKTDVAKAASVEAVKQQVEEVKNLLGTVNSTTRQIDTNVKEFGEKMLAGNCSLAPEMLQLRKNSDESLRMFESMQKSLESLAQAQTNNHVPTPNPGPSTSQPLPPAQPDGPVKRKGLMLTSSIGKDIDTKRIAETLHCDITVIPTYHLEHHPEAKDPDAHLKSVVNQHLAGQTGYQFVIIAVGSNDITCLDTDNASAVTLFEQVRTQSTLLCETTENIISDMGVDVFVVEKPPRYDPTDKDPTSMKQKLSKFSNGVLSTSLGLTTRAFLVEQASLSRSAGKARNDLFQSDGVHLTPKGLHYYSSNIIDALQDCYEDTKQIKKPVKSDKKQGGGGSGGQWQQGRGGHNDQGRRGDHPHPVAKGGQPWQGGQHRFSQPGWGNGWGGGRRGGGGGNNCRGVRHT